MNSTIATSTIKPMNSERKIRSGNRCATPAPSETDITPPSANGIAIALDDFGTGYSSLAYITRFPPDRIKIDKAFVNNVDRSPSDAAVANAILSLGKSLNLVVTAEGIERSGQLEWLRARGCDEVQGFLLSRPLSARDLESRYLIGSGRPAEPPRACAASDLSPGAERARTDDRGRWLGRCE